MLFICGTSQDPKEITDIITLHNYDYDKWLTIEKVQNIINSLK